MLQEQMLLHALHVKQVDTRAGGSHPGTLAIHVELVSMPQVQKLFLAQIVLTDDIRVYKLPKIMSAKLAVQVSLQLTRQYPYARIARGGGFRP